MFFLNRGLSSKPSISLTITALTGSLGGTLSTLVPLGLPGAPRRNSLCISRPFDRGLIKPRPLSIIMPIPHSRNIPRAEHMELKDNQLYSGLGCHFFLDGPLPFSYRPHAHLTTAHSSTNARWTSLPHFKPIHKVSGIFRLFVMPNVCILVCFLLDPTQHPMFSDVWLHHSIRPL